MSGTGIGKQVRIKAETTAGTFAGAAGSQILRRVTSNIQLSKQRLQSGELRDDYQRVTSRHGGRRVEGQLSGELSFGTYQALFEASMRKTAASVANITGLTLTVAASGSNYTITRSAGSWITDGVRVGMVVRATAGLNAASLNKNLLVLALSAMVMTVFALNDYALTIEAAVAACTVTVPGKTIVVPSTGHLDRAFSIEELNNDLTTPISRLSLGCRVSRVSERINPSSLVSVEFSFLGMDQELNATEQFTSPTAAGTTDAASGVVGVLFNGTTRIAYLTSINMDHDNGHSVEPVLFATAVPDVFEGPFVLTGQFTAMLEDATFLTAFDAESELSLAMVLLGGSTGNCDFQTRFLPRVKINSAQPDDGAKGLVQTVQFEALKLPTTTGYDSTTLSLQDSQFV